MDDLGVCRAAETRTFFFNGLFLQKIGKKFIRADLSLRVRPPVVNDAVLRERYLLPRHGSFQTLDIRFDFFRDLVFAARLLTFKSPLPCSQRFLTGIDLIVLLQKSSKRRVRCLRRGLGNPEPQPIDHEIIKILGIRANVRVGLDGFGLLETTEWLRQVRRTCLLLTVVRKEQGRRCRKKIRIRRSLQGAVYERHIGLHGLGFRQRPLLLPAFFIDICKIRAVPGNCILKQLTFIDRRDILTLGLRCRQIRLFFAARFLLRFIFAAHLIHIIKTVEIAIALVPLSLRRGLLGRQMRKNIVQQQLVARRNHLLAQKCVRQLLIRTDFFTLLPDEKLQSADNVGLLFIRIGEKVSRLPAHTGKLHRLKRLRWRISLTCKRHAL